MRQGDQGAETRARLASAQRDPAMIDAALALQSNDLPVAERLLKARLRADPDDIAALRMLAELASRVGRASDSLELLERALDIAPDFAAARINYATVLHRNNRLTDALAQLDLLLAQAPRDPNAQALKAAVLARTGDYAGAIALYDDVLGRFPQQPKLQMSHGHALKTVGRQADSVAAYRRALAQAPTLGEAWWSLANLKTVRFSDADVAAMRAALETAPTAADRYHLHYALGKALEDAGDYEASFQHYALGARQRRAELPYDPEETSRHVARTRRLMTREAFAARAGQGFDDPAPIFVVGLPRAGSTLIEQILASHSLIEGTMELPDLGAIASDLAGGRARRVEEGEDDAAHGYLDRLLALDAAGLEALGRRYVERTRIQRKTGRPFFIDKMPNNFAHAGLIHLILPNAKIIDARRHPMASCFSGFKQHFSRGQGFTYDLGEVGRYYRDYVELMDHYDAVLPGRVHRVFYENVVENPEAEIRALLAYCGVDFEPACLEFHKTDRPVRTASSEQVRRPISKDAVDHWRRYAPWLGPLEQALGEVTERYAPEAQAGRAASSAGALLR